jgi:hypothetical protein
LEFGNIEASIDNLISCLLKLVPCIEFSLARQIELTNLKKKFEIQIKWNDYASLQLLHFFPSIKVDWNAFTKFLNELKGFPQQFQDLLPFLGNFFNLNTGNSELFGLVERLARRNSAASAAILFQIGQCEKFNENIDAFSTVFEILVPSDNEIVREFMGKLSKIILISNSICQLLLKSKNFSSKGNENISKFLADCFMKNKPENFITGNFIELATNELSNESTLSALIQCAALLNSDSEGLINFLKTNLKSSQKITIKSSILFGIAKSRNFTCLNPEILKEIFSPPFLKEITTNPQSQAYFICALAALVSNENFCPDTKLFNESLVALSKPVGPAILCEKGWNSLDKELTNILLSFIVVPVVFDSNSKKSELLPFAMSAFAWFALNGSKESFKLIRSQATNLSVDKVELLTSYLERFLDGSDFKAHRCWTILQLTCSSVESLKSRSLALLCHDKNKLLGLGAGSWAELTRSACPKESIHQFCFDQLANFIPSQLLSKTCPFYLLETLISLSPALVNESLCPVENLNNSIDELMKFTPAQWSLLNASNLTTKPVATNTKSVSNKSNPSTPTNDDSSVKESLLNSIAKFKHIVSIIRTIALALPFHHLFTEIRPIVLVKLIQCLDSFDFSDLSHFIIESVYEIASESLNGQGPLLISLFLSSTNRTDLIHPSWCISDQISLIDSVHGIITLNSDVSEFSLICLVLSKSLPLSKSLADTQEFKNLLSNLFNLSEQCETVDSRVVFDFIHAVLEISQKCPISVQSSIVLLFVEIGEIPKLEIPSSQDLFKLNLALRSSSPATQLMILKFLTAFAASHSSAHSLMESFDLIQTIWLLHFNIVSEKKEKKIEDSLDEDGYLVEDEPVLIGKAYEIEEVATIAVELCTLLQLTEVPQFDALNHLLQLESETEKDLQIKNLIEHYVAALSASISSHLILDKISSEFARLLSARTTPNGIVRLTKNVDRSKLDFTKQTRKAILRAISSASKREQERRLLQNFINFCFEIGFTDPDEVNSEIIFATLISLVENCENSAAEGLYEQLQKCLNLVPADNDRVKVYSVILLGRASSRVPSLTSSSTRVWDLIDRIKESLNIPSEPVQKAVADTLVPLFRSQINDKRISTLTFGFTSRLRDAKEDYGALRGAAFGLAALIEACGTVLIRTHEIFDCLNTGLTLLNKKGSEAAVCSVLAAIEIISARCGIAFEPYIAPLVPGVLEALGDSRQRVREDAEACADAMMAALSPLSVALILPPLLDMAGMDGCDPRYSWRAKLGAVTWLGSMACLAPKVLTPALPKIIPALIVALTDAHEKVHLAAHHALAVKYAAIIRSPEIKAALPAILRALSDPPKFASACLGDIIGTSFCHAVDGPSLALLEPLLSRALRERGTGAMSEAKRRAILIIANLGSLMDPSELRPYLINLVPALRGVLGDAVPQVRSGSARALGVMMRLMHTNNLAQDCPVLMQIVPECLEIIFSTLPSITSIDRAGAAQAIAQVTAARGLDQLIELVNEQVAPVLFNEKSKSAGTSREALLHLCAALPAALSPAQIPKLYERVFTRERIFSILQSTASEDEGVREISTKTVRSLLLRQALFVDLQGALEILLKGSCDGRWRLRLTSFTILADLLPVLSMSSDGSACDTQNRSLSGEMRARVLSRLFFGRFDSNGLIRNAAFSLWKSIVTHPPRVILEILPVLVDDCVASLEIVDEFEADSEDEYEEYSESDSDSGSDTCEAEIVDVASANVKVDRYEMASSALQDILVKLNDRVLLPFLKRLSQIFTSNQSNAAGVLLAARIVTSVVIVPNLIPPHQRTANSAPVVSIPRGQIDEALKIVLHLTQQGLTSSERSVNVAVGLFGKLAQGLATSPALLDRIISELFLDTPECANALISVLNRRPRILLVSLVNRFKKLTVDNEIDWDWWGEVLAAPGPFLAPYAPSLIVHAIKLLKENIEEHLELFDALLASMSSYDPDLLYGDDVAADEDEEEADLEDSVETGLFSFGQFLETLWSARNLPILASKLIEIFSNQGSFGIERFYDIWLDRLLVSSLQQEEQSEDDNFSKALEGIIERGIEREESLTIISQLNQSIETRSIVIKNISTKLPVDLLILLIKSLCLPIISDSQISSFDRFEASKLLSNILIKNSDDDSTTSNLSRLPNQVATALIGALIRCLSDRSETGKVERLKSALLPILFTLIKEVPQIGKPFHPQLARLGVNVLKDLIVSVSFSGNSIDFDQSHPRGQIALVTCELIGLLLVQMTRSDVLIEELTQFRVDEEGIFDELSTKNARIILLTILNCSNSPNNFPQNVSNFIISTIKTFMILPNSEIEIIRKTSKIGLLLSKSLPQSQGTELETFINNLI